MTTKQVAERLIDTARKHIAAMGGSGMKSSAVSALADSLVQMELNDFECAAGRALDSLSYSIGRLHPDYQNALTVASSAAKRDGMLERLGFRIEDADGGRKGLIAKVTELWTASNRRWESACEDDDSDYQELANDCDDAYANAVHALEAGDKKGALEALESARSLESDGGDACHAIDAIALVNGWHS